MTLWRISNHSTIDGVGGLRAPGRWHTQGRRIVYLASSPASALLEIIVHLEISEEMMPYGYQLLRLEVPEDVSREVVTSDSIADKWQDDVRVSRKIGDMWLSEGRCALLAVPSALVPETANWLLNPYHADAAKVRVEWGARFPYDGRLLRTARIS